MPIYVQLYITYKCFSLSVFCLWLRPLPSLCPEMSSLTCPFLLSCVWMVKESPLVLLVRCDWPGLHLELAHHGKRPDNKTLYYSVRSCETYLSIYNWELLQFICQTTNNCILNPSTVSCLLDMSNLNMLLPRSSLSSVSIPISPGMSLDTTPIENSSFSLCLSYE